MKRKITSIITLFLVAVLTLTACGADGITAEELWSGATYSADTALGSGETTVQVHIEALGRKVTVTLSTDKPTLGEALFEAGIVDDPTFFSECNGMTADWNAHSAYWAFYIGEEYQIIGVGDAALTDGAAYRLVYTQEK